MGQGGEGEVWGREVRERYGAGRGGRGMGQGLEGEV